MPTITNVFRSRSAKKRAARLAKLATEEKQKLPSLLERSRPCQIARGVFVPQGPLTCPECGCLGHIVDMEGVMACLYDHRWWGSNSPEYREMDRIRRFQRA